MAKLGQVYLMAGAGPGTGPKSVRYHRDAIAGIGKKKPRIAYVGAASSDSLAFQKMLGPMIFGLTADVVPVKLTKKSVATSAAKEMLAEADLIFISGGDVEEGMKVINERDLAGYFRELHRQGKVFEGVSAGSIMLGEHWVRFPDEDDDTKAEIFDCLGVVPFSFDAHGEKDGWEELQVLAKLLSRAPQPPASVYGLVSGTCALWDGAKLVALGGALNRYGCTNPAEKLDDLQPT
jgi:peptidase E